MSEFNSQKTVTLDDILEKLGAFGKHQIITLILISFAFIVNSMYSVNYIFSAEDSPFRCQIDNCELSNKNGWYNFTGPQNEYKNCHRYKNNFNKTTCNPEDFNSHVVIACEDWVYSVNTSFIAEYNLACQDWKRMLVGTVHSLGLMIGLVIQGQLSDRFGRKKAICFAGVTGGVFGLFKSYANSFPLFIVFEGLEATFGDICSPSFILSIESVHSKHRTIYQAILSLFYALGGVILAAVAWWFPYWRHYIRAIYAPSILFILYVFFLDESIRWLLSKGKKEKAIHIIMKAAQRNKINIDRNTLLDLEYRPKTDEKKSPLLESFRSRIIVKRFLICTSWWISCSFIYFGLTINSVSLQGNKYLNFALLSLSDIPASFLVAFVLKYFKRKMPLFIAFILASSLCFAQIFIKKDYIWLITTLYFIGKVVSAFTFSTIYIYTSELFPTNSRNSMHALCSSVGRIGGILAPMTPLLTYYAESLPILLFGACSLVAGLLTLFVPDTADKSLPDNIEQAEVIGKMKQKNEIK